MCTLVLLRRPGAAWPLLLVANRDELYARPSLPPGRHWPDRPHVRAGLDVRAGGAWLGINDAGVIAGLLNRRGSFHLDPKARSRGDIVLRALDHATAADAAAAFAAVDPVGWRPFNLIVADAEHAFWLCHHGGTGLQLTPVPVGLHMIDAGDLDDPLSPRLHHHLARFVAADVPDPATGQWQGWQRILSSRQSPTGQPEDAMCLADVFVDGAGMAGTVSSALMALPRHPEAPPVFLHAEGSPHSSAFLTVPGSPARGGIRPPRPAAFERGPTVGATSLAARAATSSVQD